MPGLDAKDVIDIQVTVESLAVADELVEPLLAAGYPRHGTSPRTSPRPTPAAPSTRSTTRDDPTLWHKRFHASADPGRPTNVHLRVDGWPNQQFALLFADWLTANPGVRAEYLAVKRAAEDAAACRRRRPMPTPRSRGSSTPTGGRGSGPTATGWTALTRD